MDSTLPLLAVFAPTLYILGAVASLVQFQVVLMLIQQGAAKLKHIQALSFASPGVSNFADHLIKIFGSPGKYVPKPTEVILVALIIAVVVHLERARARPAAA